MFNFFKRTNEQLKPGCEELFVVVVCALYRTDAMLSHLADMHLHFPDIVSHDLTRSENTFGDLVHNPHRSIPWSNP